MTTDSKEEVNNPDFKSWLNTESGLESNDYSTLSGQKYLENRLYWAFMAGIAHGEQFHLNQLHASQEEVERLKKVVEVADKIIEISSPSDVMIDYMNDIELRKKYNELKSALTPTSKEK